MKRTRAYAKLNLALVAGPRQSGGKHEVATVMQEIDLHDDVELDSGDDLDIAGYAEDTIVRAALEDLAAAAGASAGWRVRIEKRIPVAAGLGGGSSDAAAALRLANPTLPAPLMADELDGVAARVGADVPFFLHPGSQLATGDGTDLTRIELPTDYAVLVVFPHGETKESTRSVYQRFASRAGHRGFHDRRTALLERLATVRRPRDLADLPPNDLASSPLASELVRHGAFRADVTGSGPAVYGLFEDDEGSERAASALAEHGVTWLARPVGQPELPGHDPGRWQDAFALGRGQVVRQRVLVP